MNNNTILWLHKLAAAFIGGGASAVVAGLTSMGFAPEKFNLISVEGIKSLLIMMALNFLVSGLLSIMFYLKTAPLPEIEDK